ncbi:IS3 family transposase, partial [Roseomonas mucosa]|uniref:IS3 family transposase n=1 Tax=Roseomonas mucosa TaxID=207340 RepID=UPI00209B26DB
RLRKEPALSATLCHPYLQALQPIRGVRHSGTGPTPMESFFHTLKTELVHHRTYATRNEAKRDLFSYVEGFYNRRRLHSALDYRTPDQAERQAVNVA